MLLRRNRYINNLKKILETRVRRSPARERMSRQREYHRRHDWEWSWSYESNQLRPRTLDKNAENSLMWRTLERKKWAEKGKETSTQHKKFSNFSSSFSPRLPSSLFLLIVVLWWHRLAESSTTRNFPSSFTGASSNIQPIVLSLSLLVDNYKLDSRNKTKTREIIRIIL